MHVEAVACVGAPQQAVLSLQLNKYCQDNITFYEYLHYL